MEVLLRKEIKSDYKEVYEIHQQAFERDSEADLVNLMRKSHCFVPELSIVAEYNNRLLGHILFSRIQIENANITVESLALAPLAVKPEFQNKSIGSQLIQYGLKIAREMQFKSVIVLGHKAYYPKFGFESTSKWGIQSPFKLSDEGSFMGIELIKDGLKNATGIVKYPREFESI